MKDETASILECPECHTRYELPVAIPEHGRRVRCARCGHIWLASAADMIAPWEDNRDQDIVFRDQEPAAAAEQEELLQREAAAAAEADAAPAPDAGETHPESSEDPAPAEAQARETAAADIEPDETESADSAGTGSAEEALAAAEAEPEADTATGFAAEAIVEDGEDQAVGEGFATAETEFTPHEGGFDMAETDAGLAPDAFFTEDAEEADEPSETRLRKSGSEVEHDEDALARESGGGDGEEADTVTAFYGDAPADDAAADETETEPIVVGRARRRLPVTAGAIAGWGALCLVLFGLGVLAVTQRASIVRAMPGSAWAYETFGMPVNVRGLDFRDVAYSWGTDAGEIVLEVHGDIVNVTDAAVEVPTVVLGLRAGNETEIYRWEDTVVAEPLAAGARATFAVRIPAPPEATESVQVRFARTR